MALIKLIYDSNGNLVDHQIDSLIEYPNLIIENQSLVDLVVYARSTGSDSPYSLDLTCVGYHRVNRSDYTILQFLAVNYPWASVTHDLSTIKNTKVLGDIINEYYSRITHITLLKNLSTEERSFTCLFPIGFYKVDEWMEYPSEAVEPLEFTIELKPADEISTKWWLRKGDGEYEEHESENLISTIHLKSTWDRNIDYDKVYPCLKLNGNTESLLYITHAQDVHITKSADWLGFNVVDMIETGEKGPYLLILPTLDNLTGAVRWGEIAIRLLIKPGVWVGYSIEVEQDKKPVVRTYKASHRYYKDSLIVDNVVSDSLTTEYTTSATSDGNIKINSLVFGCVEYANGLMVTERNLLNIPNCTITVSPSNSWLSYEKSSSGETALAIRAEENNTGSERTALLTVKATMDNGTEIQHKVNITLTAKTNYTVKLAYKLYNADGSLYKDEVISDSSPVMVGQYNIAASGVFDNAKTIAIYAKFYKNGVWDRDLPLGGEATVETSTPDLVSTLNPIDGLLLGLTFDVTPNEETLPRTMTARISAKEYTFLITFAQRAKELDYTSLRYRYYLYKNGEQVADSNIQKLPDSNTVNISIRANAEGVPLTADYCKLLYYVYNKEELKESLVIQYIMPDYPQSDSDWLMVSYSDYFIPIIAENNTYSARTGTITIKGMYLDKYPIIYTITVQLEAKARPDVPSKVWFSPELVTLEYSSGTYTAEFYIQNATYSSCTYSGDLIRSIQPNPAANVVTINYSENSDVERTGYVTVTVTKDGRSYTGTLTLKQKGKVLQSFTVLDTNQGEDVDPTSLLYKSNNSNIYSTIEAKDNTLFLGNYKNTDLSLKIYNKIKNYSLSFSLGTKAVDNFCITELLRNSYIPNMTLSSQLRRVFKKGEKYSLGLVFVHKTGIKSTVFKVNNSYSPSSDAYMSNTTMIKPIASVTLDSSLKTELLNLGIIGVIPVYGVRSNHNVVCQGIASGTLTCQLRETSENLNAQYDWYQRPDWTAPIGEGDAAGLNVEFQCNNTDFNWSVNRKIVTLNTPEVEAGEILTNADLADIKLLDIWRGDSISYFNNIQINTVGKYLHSYSEPMLNDLKIIRKSALWKGYLDNGDIDEYSSAFITDTQNSSHYFNFFVYPWQRNKMGGEGPESVIKSKKYFSSLFIDSTQASSYPYDVNKAFIYREEGTGILKLDSKIYQGNTDWIINPTTAYKARANGARTSGINYPRAYDNVLGGIYAGYDKLGNIKEPISMRYKTAPHIVLSLKDGIGPSVTGVHCMEIQHLTDTFDDSNQVLSSLPWIKCGNIVPITDSTTTVIFEEGDYFYGRFETLRTYPYSQEDPNSVTNIVSGMLLSRINLDARVDRNRNITAPTVTPANFNRFNTVYDQLNNYFTFQFIDFTDNMYERNFVNSIQWSMTKQYGNEIDDWCNIQDINTLDLDGNKGELTAIKKYNNDLIAFLLSGISRILYNETMQITSSLGIPIEIANSGRVNGKRYLNEVLGCQNKKAITISPTGLYFIDGLNKSFYRINPNYSIDDLCISGGMKSWGLNSINTNWVCWYDNLSHEVIFNSVLECILFSDVYNRFQCFSEYKGINYIASFKSLVYTFFQSQGSNTWSLWLKNSIASPSFFGIQCPVLIEIVANQEPTEDKTFTNIEYRVDCFHRGSYVADKSFDVLRVYNEYQDTGAVTLTYNKSINSNLKKKFRMWHIDIPRSQTYTQGNRTYTRDRIRGPWCNIQLVANSQNNGYDLIVVHDLQVQYIL